MRKLALVAILASTGILFASGSPANAEDWSFSAHFGSGYAHYSSGYSYYPAPSYYYYNPYTPAYRTYGYNPVADYYGHHETGYGRHAEGIASPYNHGTHHGYHYNPENGWHGGTHYGHN